MKWGARALDFDHVIDHLHQTNADENGMIGRILSRSMKGAGQRARPLCAGRFGRTLVNGFAG
ncbi:hypothetical protein CFR75_00770 [Komagataeibacter xylinus]|uniref:Uncharacterized protein n=1 Tax=Komagataeibacter xylinus TaxID=28448 RepID=A0A318Q6W1_KOMXY|nr:hypothetical protein CFR75_00770 [Komagataeibacter xylinus]